MKKAKTSKLGLNFRNLILILLSVFIINSIFTFVDYFAHSLSEKYSVPSWYFRNKIIFGTIIGFVAYLLVSKKGLFTRSFVFSLSISVLLQTRYFLEGYPLDFVILFLFTHFIILLPVSLIIFKLAENLFKE